MRLFLATGLVATLGLSATQHVESQEDCRSDDKCWGEMHYDRVRDDCRRLIEEEALHGSRSINGFSLPNFERWNVAGVERQIIAYIGEAMEVQAQDGSWYRVHYTCVLNTAADVVTLGVLERGVRAER